MADNSDEDSFELVSDEQNVRRQAVEEVTGNLRVELRLLEVRGIPTVRFHKAYPYMQLRLGDMYWETGILAVDGSATIPLAQSSSVSLVTGRRLAWTSPLAVEIWHDATTTRDHMLCSVTSTLQELIAASGGAPSADSVSRNVAVMMSDGAGPLVMRLTVTAETPDDDNDVSRGEYGVNGVTINQRGLAAVLTGTRDAENAASFSTYRLHVHHVDAAFGDAWNSWNRSYAAALTIFSDGLKSKTVRHGIRKQHGYLYADRGAGVSRSVLNSGHALLRLLNYGVRGGCRRYFTYVLLNNQLRFSETGAATMKDFFSKHAMHCNARRTLRYAGEFCFQQSPRTGAWRLCIDNNSGTYAPDASHLPQLQRALAANFPDLPVEVLAFADPRLPDYKQSCDRPLPLSSLAQLLAFAGDIEQAWTDVATPRLRSFLAAAADNDDAAMLRSVLAGTLTVSVSRATDVGYFDRPSSPLLVVGVTGLAGADNFLPWDVCAPLAGADGRDPVFDYDAAIPMNTLGYAVCTGQRELVIRIVNNSRNPITGVGQNAFLGEVCLTIHQILHLFKQSSSIQSSQSSSEAMPAYVNLTLSPRFGSQQSLDFVSGSLAVRVGFAPADVSSSSALPPPSPSKQVLGPAMKWCRRLNAWRLRQFELDDDTLCYYNPAAAEGRAAAGVKRTAALGSLHGRFFLSKDARDPEPYRLDVLWHSDGGRTMRLHLAVGTLAVVFKWLRGLSMSWESELLAADPYAASSDLSVDGVGQLGASLELCSPARGDETPPGSRHNFVSSSFPIPTGCRYCGANIWGIIRQGLRCSTCGYACHRDCGVLADALPCTGPQ